MVQFRPVDCLWSGTVRSHSRVRVALDPYSVHYHCFAHFGTCLNGVVLGVEAEEEVFFVSGPPMPHQRA